MRADNFLQGNVIFEICLYEEMLRVRAREQSHPVNWAFGSFIEKKFRAERL